MLEIYINIMYNGSKTDMRRGRAMDLLMVPVPLFNRDMAVEAYYFRYQKGNDLIQGSKATSVFDGAMRSPLLEALNTVGLEAFAMGKPIFIPVNSLMLLADLDHQCDQPSDKVIFLLDNEVKVEEAYTSSVKRLKSLGYRFGIQKLETTEGYGPMLELCDYIFLDHRILGTPGQIALLQGLNQKYRHLKKVITHINTMEMFNGLGFVGAALFEGRFYRTPITKGKNKVSPLQVNLIKLLNLVGDDSFEFSEVTKIIQKDTALTVSLMRLVNSPYIGLSQKVKTISHAVTMLGQQEVRKWVTTAVSRLLGAEKPDEITRLSLTRARFAETLASHFGLGDESQGLFLMGLFSVLDVILEKPMSEALDMVRVADPIRDALEGQKGEYYPIYQFIMYHQTADWKAMSRMLIVYDLSLEDIYQSYIDALCWYRDLLSDNSVY